MVHLLQFSFLSRLFFLDLPLHRPERSKLPVIRSFAVWSNGSFAWVLIWLGLGVVPRLEEGDRVLGHWEMASLGGILIGCFHHCYSQDRGVDFYIVVLQLKD